MDARDMARWVGSAPTYVAQFKDQGSAAAPGPQQVIADTGPLLAGSYDVFYWVTSSAALAYNGMALAWRNAANTGYVWYHYIASPGAYTFFGFILGLRMAQDERLRLETGPAFAGTVTASIIAICKVL